MSVRVRLLQANHGDSILVTHEGSEGVFNLLIDGGNPAAFRYGARGRYNGALAETLDDLKDKKQKIDLLILTHIDDDHIGGLLKAFSETGYLSEMTKAVWFNSSRMITEHLDKPKIPENNVYLADDSPQTSVKQGIELEAFLDQIGCKRQALVKAGQTLKAGPFTFSILSPNEKKLENLLCQWPTEKDSAETSAKATDYSSSFSEILVDDKFEGDTSIANGSSIAFILEADDKRMLFLGDAHDETVLDSLRKHTVSSKTPIHFDIVKISHHGSQFNTSPETLKLIKSPRYLISTDGSKHGLPNKKTLARILSSNNHGKIFFNYQEVITRILLPGEVEKYSAYLKALNGDIEL